MYRPEDLNSQRITANRALADCPSCGQRCVMCYRPCRKGFVTHDDFCADYGRLGHRTAVGCIR